jgi:hypothetical protein
VRGPVPPVTEMDSDLDWANIFPNFTNHQDCQQTWHNMACPWHQLHKAHCVIYPSCHPDSDSDRENDGVVQTSSNAGFGCSPVAEMDSDLD